MEEILSRVLTVLAAATEAVGALVVILGVVRAFYQYLRGMRTGARRLTPLRLDLGQHLVFALEFHVAADILKTALDPSFEDLGLLTAIIALRTVLSLVLER